MEFKSGPIKIQVGAAAPTPRDAEADRAQLQAIQARLTAGDLEGAAELARTALAGGLEHPLTFNLTAGMLEADDRFAESVSVLQRGHRAFPQDPGLTQALGLGLFRLQRFAEALPHFDAMTAAQPGFAQAHAARGAVLDALGRDPEAEAAYRRALDLQGDNLLALAGLAGTAARAGRHDEARRCAEQVLAAEPGYPEAVMALARADLAEGYYDDGVARLEALIADPRASDPQRDVARELIADITAARTRKFDA
ncbi:tetratricopeptide repeat protein [Phenylobacterium sp.]|jgi:tetratricopeptide (TPR) repeat protein|uniref:tetratricopeptide repeat protein n=1 Tax=Phenylobacterium sp. TaxID=1871053 RepID=UPI002F3FB250